MNTLKSIGGFILGIIIFIGIILAGIFIFTLGIKAAVVVEPYIEMSAGVLLVLNVITLLIAAIPAARGVTGVILFISSYVYGLATWLYGLLVTLSLWGVIALIIGLLMGGVGVVPIGMLAALFHGQWYILFSLLGLVILTYGTRILATVLMASYEQRHEEDEVIKIEPEVEDRSWKDLE